MEVGNTGKFNTIDGAYEVTIDKAKLIGGELDGVESAMDDFSLTDITIKNTDDDMQMIDNIVVVLTIIEKKALQVRMICPMILQV